MTIRIINYIKSKANLISQIDDVLKQHQVEQGHEIGYAIVLIDNASEPDYMLLTNLNKKDARSYFKSGLDIKKNTSFDNSQKVNTKV